MHVLMHEKISKEVYFFTRTSLNNLESQNADVNVEIEGVRQVIVFSRGVATKLTRLFDKALN
jgi:hypothetical protein